jgi:hypothetical protein
MILPIWFSADAGQDRDLRGGSPFAERAQKGQSEKYLAQGVNLEPIHMDKYGFRTRGHKG